jgi:uncharacterized membrane protein YhaH (DUF805 family)
MMNSTRIAGLVGPALIAISVTEWMNLGVFTAAIGPSFAPHVYLNGTLLFVAGLAIVRAHNHWTRGWPVLVTLVGWVAMLGGLGRMVAPISAQQAGQSSTIVYASLAALLAIGVVLTFKSYGRSESKAGRRPGGHPMRTVLRSVALLALVAACTRPGPW